MLNHTQKTSTGQSTHSNTPHLLGQARGRTQVHVDNVHIAGGFVRNELDDGCVLGSLRLVVDLAAKHRAVCPAVRAEGKLAIRGEQAVVFHNVCCVV